MEEHKATILTVDDEESIRDILCRKLTSLGYHCEVAVDGNEALWKAFMQDFDLVLMDIKMPGLTGMEVLPKLVTDHPDTCVIMLTAVSDIQTAVEAMKLGAFDYLTKPFNLDDLVMRVQRALDRRRLVLENREYQRRLELKVEQQAGRIRQFNTEAEKALNREQVALAELGAARMSSQEEDSTAQSVEDPASSPGTRLARKLSQLLGNKSMEELASDSDSGVTQAKVTHAEDRPRSSGV